MRPGKKITVLLGRPFVPFLVLCPRFVPIWPISAAVCLHIGSQKLAQILSVYTKQSLAAGAPTQILLEELTTLPQTPKSNPRRALAPYNSRLRRSSWVQIAVTLAGTQHISWDCSLPNIFKAGTHLPDENKYFLCFSFWTEYLLSQNISQCLQHLPELYCCMHASRS